MIKHFPATDDDVIKIEKLKRFFKENTYPKLVRRLMSEIERIYNL